MLNVTRSITVVAATVAVMAAAAASAAAAGPPQTVTARLIRSRPGELRSGTAVSSKALGQRIFVNAARGFALASADDGDYPALTTDGGRTWRTAGPALHVNAAQAPLTVLDVGAANAHTFFAFGGGQVVDVTSDAGKHWYSALLGDVVIAAVRRPAGGLLALAQDAPAGGNTAVNLVYVSTDAGRHWHLNNRVGAF